MTILTIKSKSVFGMKMLEVAKTEQIDFWEILENGPANAIFRQLMKLNYFF